VEIAEQNGSLRAGYDEDDKDEEEKSKHVVQLMRPDAAENEEKLDEDAAKWKDASHDDAN
jgi:hypothetical protein